MIISISGTPGTGKTTLASELRKRGYFVSDLNEHIRENGLIGEMDKERDTYDVDVQRLKGSLENIRTMDGAIFIEGHLAHLLDPDITIVLRCSPSVLQERLERRGYNKKKITENVHAELLDVILCESVDSCARVYEFDCTNGIDMILSSLEDVLSGNAEDHLPGSVDRSEEMLKWF